MVAHVDVSPGSPSWLRLARGAKLLATLTLVWLGIEGTVGVVAGILAGSRCRARRATKAIRSGSCRCSAKLAGCYTGSHSNRADLTARFGPFRHLHRTSVPLNALNL